MFKSSGNPMVAAAKANLWSETAQAVLDLWHPHDELSSSLKHKFQEELDSMERAREDLGLDDTDPRQHKQAAKMLREEKMLIKKLHEKIVFYKTESDRKRRIQQRAGGGHNPDQYMDQVLQGNHVPNHHVQHSVDSELGGLERAPSKSKFFSLFGKKKQRQIAPPPMHDRQDSYDDEGSSPRLPMAIANEPHHSPAQSHHPPTAVYPVHHDRNRGEYEPTVIKTSSDRHDRQPTSASRQPRDREKYHSDGTPRRTHDKYDDSSKRRTDDRDRDRDRYKSSASRRDYDRRTREPTSTSQRDRDRSRTGDEYTSSRRRKHYSEDGGVDPADADRRRRHRSERDKDRDRDRDRSRGGEPEDPSRHRRHRSEGGHHKSRSGKDNHRATSRHSATRHPEEMDRERSLPAEPPLEDEHVPEEYAEEHEGGDVLSVSEQLHGSLNVGE